MTTDRLIPALSTRSRGKRAMTTSPNRTPPVTSAQVANSKPETRDLGPQTQGPTAKTEADGVNR